MKRPQKITFADVRDTGVRALLILRRLPLQPLDRDQRRWLARCCQAVRHRGTVCVPGLRQARRRRAAGFQLE